MSEIETDNADVMDDWASALAVKRIIMKLV